MKTLKQSLLILLFLLPSLLQAMEKEIPFTLDDRDRIIRTEQKVESLQTEMNARFKAIDERFSQLFGFLWFVMLFLAAITSSLAMLQPVIAFFEEGFGLKRHASVAFLGLLCVLGSALVVYFSKGLVALDTFDFWAGTMLLICHSRLCRREKLPIQ